MLQSRFITVRCGKVCSADNDDDREGRSYDNLAADADDDYNNDEGADDENDDDDDDYDDKDVK